MLSYFRGSFLDSSGSHRLQLVMGLSAHKEASVLPYQSNKKDEFHQCTNKSDSHLKSKKNQFSFLTKKLKQDMGVIKQSEENLNKVLDVYEQRLGESRFFGGR